MVIATASPTTADLLTDCNAVNADMAVFCAKLKQVLDKIETGVDSKASHTEANTFYLLWAGALIFLMQAGFATLSAGSIRQKNVKNSACTAQFHAQLVGTQLLVTQTKTDLQSISC